MDERAEISLSMKTLQASFVIYKENQRKSFNTSENVVLKSLRFVFHIQHLAIAVKGEGNAFCCVDLHGKLLSPPPNTAVLYKKNA